MGMIVMSPSTQGFYEDLLSKCKDMTVLRSAAGIVQWDMETMMPPKGINLRSEQLGLLDLLSHKMLTDPAIAELLRAIESSPSFPDMDQVQRRNVRLIRKSYDEAVKLPEALVSGTAKQVTLSVGAWKRAKAAKDYSIFKPELAKTIELKKQAGDILMRVKGTSNRYDALIDSFEPNMTADRVTAVFSEMRDQLIQLMRKIEASEVKPDLSIVSRYIPMNVQRKISALVMQFIGFDTTSAAAGGRLDETVHPFSTGYYDDIRITTHYYENRFVSSFYSVMHEGGHALYEQGFPPEWMYQPVGSAASYGIHESQSRFVENIVGRSPECLRYLLPRIRKATGARLKGVGLKDFTLAANAVTPSKIRVEADEVTYGLHIIIRFEMERDLFADKLTVDELPQVWNEKYDKYLGVSIENDSEGVMQDTHWASGYFGYFPSYALGNIYSGMWLDRLEKDVPEWRQRIGRGDFAAVRDWLRQSVHSKANLYDPEELVQVITGQSLKVGPFMDYLNRKYGRLYGF